jgi:hypothetical protein
MKIFIVIVVSLTAVSSGLKIALRPENNTQLFEEETRANNSSSSGEAVQVPTEPSTNSSTFDDTTFILTAPPTLEDLAQRIGETITTLNAMIFNATRSARAEEGEEFIKVVDVLRHLQTMIAERGANISDTARIGLEREVKGLQTFLHTRNATGTTQNVKIGVESSQHPDASAKDALSSHRQSKSLMDNLMQITSQVGSDLRSTVEGAENVVSSTVSQVQQRIRSFISGVTDFFLSPFKSNDPNQGPAQQSQQQYQRIHNPNDRYDPNLIRRPVSGFAQQ